MQIDPLNYPPRQWKAHKDLIMDLEEKYGTVMVRDLGRYRDLAPNSRVFGGHKEFSFTLSSGLNLDFAVGDYLLLRPRFTREYSPFMISKVSGGVVTFIKLSAWERAVYATIAQQDEYVFGQCYLGISTYFKNSENFPQVVSLCPDDLKAQGLPLALSLRPADRKAKAIFVKLDYFEKREFLKIILAVQTYGSQHDRPVSDPLETSFKTGDGRLRMDLVLTAVNPTVRFVFRDIWHPNGVELLMGYSEFVTFCFYLLKDFNLIFGGHYE